MTFKARYRTTDMAPRLRNALACVAFLILLGIIASASADDSWTDQELPLADKEKPLWQWTGWPPPGNMWIGGKCKRVRIEDTRTEAEIRADLEIEYEEKMKALDLKEYKRGGWMVTLGLLILSLSVAAHFMTSLPQVQRICEGAGLSGIGIAVVGFVQKKSVEFDVQIWWAMILLVGLFVVYKMRNWSITHPFKWIKSKLKPSQGNATNEQ